MLPKIRKNRGDFLNFTRKNSLKPATGKAYSVFKKMNFTFGQFSGVDLHINAFDLHTKKQPETRHPYGLQRIVISKLHINALKLHIFGVHLYIDLKSILLNAHFDDGFNGLSAKACQNKKQNPNNR